MVVPRAIGGGGTDVTDPVSVGLVTANMKLGMGDVGALADLVEEKDAEFLAVQELTPELARELRGELGSMLPHRVYAPLPGSAGSGLYSELAPKGASKAALPGGFPMPRAFFDIDAGPRIEIFDVHTLPPTSQQTTIWDNDLRALPRAGDETLRILAGDFNSTLDHAELRELVSQGYADAADARGSGLTPTWPVEDGGLPALVAIDHVLADERIGFGDVSIHTIPDSDHRAVFAELLLPR
jgi:endonuclease/exonuclease/phosphatase family metal-dependent hydrolase